MRKLMVLGMCALAMSLVGCSKASPSKTSPAESLLREGITIRLEKEIQEKLEKFKNMTPDEQEKAIKEAEEHLEQLKRNDKMKEAREKLK